MKLFKSIALAALASADVYFKEDFSVGKIKKRLLTPDKLKEFMNSFGNVIKMII